MKKIITLTIITVLTLSMMMLPSCGKSEFGITENTGKLMTINAEKAGKDDYFVVGTLYVEEGEQIEINADLSEGSVRVEILGGNEETSAEEVPDLSGEAIITADLDTTESASGTVPAGGYMLKATCLEKATGTVTIEVTPAK